MKKLLVYHGYQSIKDEILSQLKRHYDADEIVKGQYWQNGKGCAVGCTLHSNNHKEYETKFGIPGGNSAADPADFLLLLISLIFRNSTKLSQKN